MDNLLHGAISRPCLRLRCRAGNVSAGQRESERCAALLLALHRDAATVRFHDVLDDRQAQPAPRIARLTRNAEEFLEDAREVLTGYAAALVTDGKFHGIIDDSRGHGDDPAKAGITSRV